MNRTRYNPADGMPDRMTCRQAFEFYDTDGNGTLSLEELKEALKREGGGSPLTDAELSEIVNEFDVNHDGLISFSEFQRMWGEEPAPAASRTVVAAPRTVVGKLPPPLKANSDLPPLVSAPLAEQASILARETGGRSKYHLRAVLSNVPAKVFSTVDDTVATHLGLKLRYVAGETDVARPGTVPKTAGRIAPCAQLFEPPEGLAGYYEGMVLLFFYPDVPPDALEACEAAMTKLLEIRHEKKKVVNHVVAVPCGWKGSDFFAAPAESESGLRKRWRTAGMPGCQPMREHRQLDTLLTPLIGSLSAAVV